MRATTLSCGLLLLLLVTLQGCLSAMPEQGKWRLHFNSSHEYNGVTKNVVGDTKVYIRIHCRSANDQMVKIGWLLRETQCWNEYSYLDAKDASSTTFFATYYDRPAIHLDIPGFNGTNSRYIQVQETEHMCDSTIALPAVPGPPTLRRKREAAADKKGAKKADAGFSSINPISDNPQYSIKYSGDYLLVLHIQGAPQETFFADVEVAFKSPHGFLSLVDHPLLTFYGAMCAGYVVMGLIWLVLCGLHWRDILRIQFWIGGVIFLGMQEKAMFLAEYANINETGTYTTGLMFAAETVSCAKRTLARMLVIIVSLGFGIVKPRLGPTMHRVLAIGGLYFFIATSEAILRVMRPKNDTSSLMMMASIPLAVIDSSICWWVFSALVETTRTLRLRRNLIKLSLYRHFANTLVFSVVASVTFMLWSIKYHRMEACLVDWRDLWMDDAFWHILFSVILCVIMFLWRPSQNNQRYAFSPLLDAEDDAFTSDDEGGDEDDPFFKDKVTKRMIGGKPANAPKQEEEDPMKWIEEHIPESENPLPVLDSEEEAETANFQFSKMN